MAEIVERAREALAACESALRDLVGEAAQRGDYDSALWLTDYAKRLSALREKAKEHAEGKGRQAVLYTASISSQPTATKRVRQRARSGAYPKFFRRNDHLVKVGWSKKRGQEYTHRAPKRLVEVVGRARHGATSDFR